MLVLVSLLGCSRPADRPIEGWPTRPIIPNSLDAGRIAGELNKLGTKPGAFTLVWTETELTSYLASILPPGDEVTLWCEPDLIYVKYSNLRLKGHSLRARLSPWLNTSQVQFELQGVWFDNQLLGSWISQPLQNMLNDVLVDTLGQYRFQKFSAESEQLRIQGNLD